MAKQESQPTKVSQTILLNGGMQDDTPEYLQEQPTMAYAENISFSRSGESQKTAPISALTDPALTATPGVLGTQDGKLFVSTGDGVVKTYEEDTADWNTVPSVGFVPSYNTRVTQTPAATGAANFTFAEDDTARLVAYEQRIPGSTVPNGLPETNVVIEKYTLSGSLIYRSSIDNATTPKAINTGSSLVAYYYNRDDGSVYRWKDGSSVEVITDVEFDLPSWKYASQAREGLRYGFCEDGGGYANYSVCGQRATTGTAGGFIAWVDTAGDGYVGKLSGSGIATGSALGTIFGTVTSNYWGRVLDTDMYGDNAAVLIGDTNSGPDSVDFSTGRYDVSGSTPVEDYAPMSIINGVSDYDGSVINGSVVLNDIGSTAYAVVTYVGQTSPTSNVIATVDEDTMVAAGSVVYSTGTRTNYGTFYGHRLASKAVLAVNPSNFSNYTTPSAVLEQYSTVEPFSSATGPLPHLTAQKPVTPVLVRFIAGGENEVHGAYDIISSKTVNASAGEQNAHLNSLYYDRFNLRYKYINRVMLQPEDPIVWEDPVTTSPTNENKGKGVGYAGDFQGRVYYTDRLGQTTTFVESRYKAASVQQYGKTALISGAVPAQFDGRYLGECSVLDQPEITNVRVSGGSDPAKGGYAAIDSATGSSWQVVVGFTDSQGVVHRSAPSLPWFTDLGAVAGSVTTVTFTPPLTGYGPDFAYFVEVYEGTGSAEPQLATTRPIYPGASAATNGSVTYTSHIRVNGAWTKLIRFSEVLYTAGNVLPSDPWLSFDDFVVTADRMFGVHGGNLYYSKRFEENISPEFSAALFIAFGQSRKLTAIGAVDDKVVVFEKNAIHVLYGGGPDNTGANGDFTVDKLQSPFGCEDPESVVEIPDGILFYSSVTEEFHLISKNLEVIDVGGAVSELSAGSPDITGAVVLPYESEVRWYLQPTTTEEEFGPAPSVAAGVPARPPRPRFTNVLPTAPVLAYNYGEQKWSVLSDQDATLACAYNGGAALIDSNRDVYVTSETWSDSVPVKLRTPWIRIANLQTYGSIDELCFIGKYYSSWNDNGGGFEAGDVQITLEYDYEGYGAASDVYLFRANAGDLGTDRMQFSVHPGRRKCQAIRVTIEEVLTTKLDDDEPTYSLGRGFALTGMDIVYTQKAGLGTQTTPARTGK